MAVFMDCFGLTDVGKVRETNQDQFMIGDLRKSLEVFQTSLSVEDHAKLFGGSQGRLLIVADGMGGHAAGERASTLALDTLSAYALNSLQWFFRLEQDSDEEFVSDLREAMERCDQTLKAEGDVLSANEGMGTTLTLAYVIWPRVYVVHAGDSRCYLIRDKRLWQMTRDHTMAQELVDEGMLSKQDAASSSSAHVLWNCVGGVDDVQPHAHRADLYLDDGLLLCSDGLTKHVSDEQISSLLKHSESAEIACRKLVDAANDAGGTDNITVVLARFKETSPEPSLAAESEMHRVRPDKSSNEKTTPLADPAN